MCVRVSHPEKKEYLPRVYHSFCLRVQKNVSAAPLPRCVALAARDGIATPHHDAILVLAGKQASSIG